jgi:drug/metabolite transporter (DMT)-like permease
MNQRIRGIRAALLSALFLGLAPVFGKQAISLGMSPLAVAALRTTFAAFLMLMTIAFIRPRYLFIYPAGLLGCLLAGGINGLGSLLFYGALARIDASVGQLLNSTYPLFVALWFALDYQPPKRSTVFRLVLTLPAIYLLTQTGEGHPLDLLGVGMMLGAAALYALHLPINQRVLFEMPAPTVTLYTLIAMTLVVVPAFLVFDDHSQLLEVSTHTWLPLAALALVTFLSRLTLFSGVKHLGGMQTSLISLGELLVTVGIASLWLGENLSAQQWLGALLLIICILLILFDQIPPPKRVGRGWLHWLALPDSALEYQFKEEERRFVRPISEKENFRS